MLGVFVCMRACTLTTTASLSFSTMLYIHIRMCIKSSATATATPVFRRLCSTSVASPSSSQQPLRFTCAVHSALYRIACCIYFRIGTCLRCCVERHGTVYARAINGRAQQGCRTHRDRPTKYAETDKVQIVCERHHTYTSERRVHVRHSLISSHTHAQKPRRCRINSISIKPLHQSSTRCARENNSDLRPPRIFSAHRPSYSAYNTSASEYSEYIQLSVTHLTHSGCHPKD